jgi:hypothetical protein
MKNRFALSAAAIALLIGLSAPAARAGYVVVLTEQVGDVGLPAGGRGRCDGERSNRPHRPAFLYSSSGLPLIDLGVGEITTGQISETPLDAYTGIAGPTSFGNGHKAFAESGGGDFVGITASASLLFVPAGYVSASPLSDTSDLFWHVCESWAHARNVRMDVGDRGEPELHIRRGHGTFDRGPGTFDLSDAAHRLRGTGLRGLAVAASERLHRRLIPRPASGSSGSSV